MRIIHIGAGVMKQFTEGAWSDYGGTISNANNFAMAMGGSAPYVAFRDGSQLSLL